MIPCRVRSGRLGPSGRKPDLRDAKHAGARARCRAVGAFVAEADKRRRRGFDRALQLSDNAAKLRPPAGGGASAWVWPV